jgi:cytochrome P450
MLCTASVDTELDGKQIKTGDNLLRWYISGNRDEDVMARADEFIIDRPLFHRHTSSGSGIPRCLGYQLAKMQMRVVWEHFFKRFHRVEVVGDPQRTFSVFVHGYTELPVRVHPTRH